MPESFEPLPRRTLEIATGVLDAAFAVHRTLGPGLLESTYEICLEHELRLRGREVQRQVALPVVYDTVKLDAGYRIDLIVDGAVIVEVKSVDALAPVHEAQVLTLLEALGAQARVSDKLQRCPVETGHQAHDPLTAIAAD